MRLDYELINCEMDPGARPTNNILIKFEILPKFAVLWFNP